MEITIAFDNVATEPTDKSKPFTASEIVSPTAMMVTIEIDRKILMIFPDCKNAGSAAGIQQSIRQSLRWCHIDKRNQTDERMAAVS